MSRTCTNTDPTPGARRRRHFVVPTAVAVLMVGLVAAVAAITAPKAATHPSYGQPCSRCHTQSLTTSLTLKASKATVARGGTVKFSGILAIGRSDQKITIKKSRNGGAWTVWKRVSLTSSLAYSASWKPALKGAYRFKARYPGDNQYKPASSTVARVRVR
jgi:hypothetical protein